MFICVKCAYILQYVLWVVICIQYSSVCCDSNFCWDVYVSTHMSCSGFSAIFVRGGDNCL